MVSSNNKSRALGIAAGRASQNYRNFAVAEAVSTRARNTLKNFPKMKAQLARDLAASMNIKRLGNKQRSLIRNRVRSGLPPTSPEINAIAKERQRLMNQATKRIENLNFGQVAYNEKPIRNRALKGWELAFELDPPGNGKLPLKM